MPVVVLAKMKAGQIEDWKRLDEVWALVGDKPAFASYVRGADHGDAWNADKMPHGRRRIRRLSRRPAIPVPSGDLRQRPISRQGAPRRFLFPSRTLSFRNSLSRRLVR